MRSDSKGFDEADSGNVPYNYNSPKISGWGSEVVAEFDEGSKRFVGPVAG